MEPPTKKHKNEEEAGPSRSPEINIGAGGGGVQMPNLSIEVIARIACFASTTGRAKNNDLQNICVAVGPRDVAVLRHTYLFKNLQYLHRCLLKYLLSPLNKRVIARQKLRSNILTWMSINTDWRVLCRKGLIDRFAVVQNNDRTLVTHPLAIFNNPAVAIELGLLEVLKYLVEKMQIDIGSYKWNCYASQTKSHLIETSIRAYSKCQQYSKEVFEYLLTIEGVDIHKAGAMRDGARPIILHAAFNKSACTYCFTALTKHKSFVPNPTNINEVNDLLLLNAFFPILAPTAFKIEQMSSIDLTKEKVKVLLEAGVDPNFRGNARRSPLSILKERTPAKFKKGTKHYNDAMEILSLVEQHVNNN